MTEPPLRYRSGVTLVGGGEWTDRDLRDARRHAPVIVAADGGADRLDALGETPRAIVGDLDSLADPASWPARTQLLPVREQDSTDLQKCLYSIAAPLFIGIGFTGGRFDHTLAALHAMAAAPDKRLVLIGAEDVMFLPPRDWRITLEAGTRLSLWPLSSVTTVRSSGLRWPVDGLRMAVGEQIGTSNETVAEEVSITFDGPGALVILPRACLGEALLSLGVGG